MEVNFTITEIIEKLGENWSDCEISHPDLWNMTHFLLSELHENTAGAMRGKIWFGMTLKIEQLLSEKRELRKLLLRATSYVRGNPELTSEAETAIEAAKNEEEFLDQNHKASEQEYIRMEKELKWLREKPEREWQAKFEGMEGTVTMTDFPEEPPAEEFENE